VVRTHFVSVSSGGHICRALRVLLHRDSSQSLDLATPYPKRYPFLPTILSQEDSHNSSMRHALLASASCSCSLRHRRPARGVDHLTVMTRQSAPWFVWPIRGVRFASRNVSQSKRSAYSAPIGVSIWLLPSGANPHLAVRASN